MKLRTAFYFRSHCDLIGFVILQSESLFTLLHSQPLQTLLVSPPSLISFLLHSLSLSLYDFIFWGGG